jgi:hypothetical protein
MANTLLKLGGVAVAIGGAYLYMKNKGKKEQEQVLANLPTTTQPMVTTDAGTYTKDEAKKLAMSVVDKVILQLDQIPKERLADKNKNLIRQEEYDAKLADYKKAKALAISGKKEQFTFLGKTYTSGITNKGLISTTNKGGQEIIDGKISPFTNEFEFNIRQNLFDNFFADKTLGDYVKRVKKFEWTKIYDWYLNAFTKMPKSQVNSLIPILPKIATVNDDFAYFYEYAEKNPLTREETIIYREANIEQYAPKRDAVLGTTIKTAIQLPRV